MIGALGAMGDADSDTGSWGSQDPNALGGANNRAAPGSLTNAVSLTAISPWSRSDMLMAAARTSVSSSYKQEAASQGITLKPAVAAVKAVAPPSSDISREVIIAGAAVVGLGIIGAIIYKLRKRR